jgi:hypothetical protein
MLWISIPKTDLGLLATEGVNGKINGLNTVIRREHDYLCYDGNRCKILKEVPTLAGVRQDDGTIGQTASVTFFCASHGEEDEPHQIDIIDIYDPQDPFAKPN